MTTQRPGLRQWAANAIEYEVLRHAAKSHEICVISSGVEPGAAVAELDALGMEVHGVSWHRNAQARNDLIRIARVVTRDSEAIYFRHGNRSEAIAEVVARVEARFGADVVHVQGEAAPAVGVARAPSVLWLFDEHTRVIAGELYAAVGVKDRVLWRLQLAKMRRWERRHYSRASSIACVSTRDAEDLGRVLGRPGGGSPPIEAIPSPIPQSFFDAPQQSRVETSAVFVGSLGWRPNVDAVEWLLSDVWPKVLEFVPDARLRIVGRDPSPAVREAASRASVTLDADVEDVRPAYWEASVVLAPIRLGAGLQTKVIHAMACGAPIVATPRAVEGTGALHQKHLLVAASAEDFADAIREVFKDPAAAAVRAVAARELGGQFHIDVVGAQIEDWWSRTASDELPNLTKT